MFSRRQFLPIFVFSLMALALAPLVAGDGAPGVQEQALSQHMLKQLRSMGENIKDNVMDGGMAALQAANGYRHDLGGVIKEDWHILRGRKAGGEQVEPPSEEGLLAMLKRRSKESALPAVAATGAAIGIDFLFEAAAQTASRRRNKSIVLPLLLLASVYGTHLSRHPHTAANGQGGRESAISNKGVRDRLAVLGISSGLITFVVSLIKQWTKGEPEPLLDEDGNEKPRRKRPGIRQHFLWSVEVGCLYALAAGLGYTFDGWVKPAPVTQ